MSITAWRYWLRARLWAPVRLPHNALGLLWTVLLRADEGYFGHVGQMQQCKKWLAVSCVMPFVSDKIRDSSVRDKHLCKMSIATAIQAYTKGGCCLQVLTKVIKPLPSAPAIQIMREHTVGFILACGIAHRINELFCLFDIPQVSRHKPNFGHYFLCLFLLLLVASSLVFLPAAHHTQACAPAVMLP